MDNTQRNVLEIFNEVKNTQFRTLDDAVEEYGMAYVFDVWLRYEGIVGYTSDIFEVLRAVGFNIDMQEDW
jgi:hypothetical protein